MIKGNYENNCFPLKKEMKILNTLYLYMDNALKEYIDEIFAFSSIKNQFLPSDKENEDLLGTLDPQLEIEYTKSPRLIHRYENRVAFLTTDECFLYCRHCFRRRFSGKGIGEASRSEIEELCNYLHEHNEVKEILLTGGDLFTLTDESFEFLLSSVKNVRKDLIIRLCTRALLSNPYRFTDNLFRIIERYNYGAPFYLMTQFNHPDEITDKAVEIVKKFLSLGIIAFNQAVLLRNINDSADIQIELCNKLLSNRIKPYYLFQGDLVKGTAHLRVPLSKGLKIEKEMRRKLSGLGLPNYVIDLPSGGGKVPLSGSYVKKLDNGWWTVETVDGEERKYPEDK